MWKFLVHLHETYMKLKDETHIDLHVPGHDSGYVIRHGRQL